MTAAIEDEVLARRRLLETGRIVVSGKAADISKDESIRRSYLGY
jgi:ABC-type lipopolysaccharide export system ATPase subunit